MGRACCGSPGSRVARNALDGSERRVRSRHWSRVRTKSIAPRSSRSCLGLLRHRRLGTIQRARDLGGPASFRRDGVDCSDLDWIPADDDFYSARSTGAAHRWMALGIRDAGTRACLRDSCHSSFGACDATAHGVAARRKARYIAPADREPASHKRLRNTSVAPNARRAPAGAAKTTRVSMSATTHPHATAPVSCEAEWLKIVHEAIAPLADHRARGRSHLNRIRDL